MSIVRAINSFYKDKEKRGWDRGYFFIDLHGTVIKPNYQAGNIPKEFYPYAKETLQLLSEISDIIMVMFTSSHPHEIVEYVKWFEENKISFNYINENPEVPTDINGYGCYDKKPYINVLFDDKAGFSGDDDWLPVLECIKELYSK